MFKAIAPPSQGGVRVTIHRVNKIPKMDMFGHADPYVKVESWGQEVWRTKTIKNCKDAEFNESSLIPTATGHLMLIVCDEDLVKDEVVGAIGIELKDASQVTATLEGAEAGGCTITYSVAVEKPVDPSKPLKRSEPLQRIELNAFPDVTCGVSWDETSTRQKTDVDLVCVAMDSTGLILDVCFFNNMTALNGALTHGGDRRDGGASGIDESISIRLGQVPPHVFSLMFCVQASGNDLSAARALSLHFTTPQGAVIAPPIAYNQWIGAGVSFAIIGAARRWEGGRWSFDAEALAYAPPIRNFVDGYEGMATMLSIDPILARELQHAQPTYSLSKGNSQVVAAGMSHVTFGLGWDAGCDVDGSCIGLASCGKEAFRVYFGNRDFQGDIVKHSGDNTTGVGSGDDEQIVVQLAIMPPTVVSLFFCVNVYTSGKSFVDVNGEYCRLLDSRPGVPPKELIRFKTMDSGTHNGMVMVSMHRLAHFPQQWRFIAEGFPAEGRTCADMVDECQKLQKRVQSELPNHVA